METGVDKIVATIQDSEFPTGKQVTIQHVCGALANTISIIFASKVTLRAIRIHTKQPAGIQDWSVLQLRKCEPLGTYTIPWISIRQRSD